jgi:hypothetical protein
MIPNTNNQTNDQSDDRSQPARADDHPNLSHRYGSIGIQAVAAAARYCNVSSDKPARAHRIDLRFVESAG